MPYTDNGGDSRSN